MDSSFNEEMKPRSRTFSRGLMNRKSKTVEEENSRLKEMLQQSLSREADALRKLKHLQLKYLQVLSKNSSVPDASPKFERKAQYKLASSDGYSSPNLSPPNDVSITTTYPQLVINQDDCHDYPNSYEESQLDKLPGETMDNGFATLAPLPQGLRDIRQEREKPPADSRISPTAGSPTTGRHETLTSEHKLMSRSHESINTLHRTKSEPTRRRHLGNNGGGPFWKKKRGQVSDLETTTDLFDSLFKNFLGTYSAQPDPLKQYLGGHWARVCLESDCGAEEGKYRDAVWEIFQAETKYLTCQLQPLEQVCKHFLEELQFYGFLSDVSIERIFGNLSEVIELTASTAKDLFKLFDRRSGSNIAQTSELALAFSMFGHNFHPVYKAYCINYEQQRSYIKELEQNSHFQEYVRVCRTAPSVQKSDINDLLIAPMQHQFHYKLLLENILKRTRDPQKRSMLASVIQAFEVSLKELNSAIAAYKSTLELGELSESIYWPPVKQMPPPIDPYIPHSVAEFTSHQRCTDIITSGDRYLIVQGPFKLLDAKGKFCLDMHLILLNDLLFVTETRNVSNKKVHQYLLVNQPIEPCYLSVHRPPSSLRPIIILISHSSLGQQLSIFSLMAPTLEERDKWMTTLLSAGAKLV